MADATTQAGHRLLGDALIIQIGRGFQVALNFGTFVLLARGLGAERFGVFSTIVAILATALAMADLGLGQLTVRAVAQGRHDELRAVRQATPMLYGAATLILLACCAASWVLTGQGAAGALACALIGSWYLHVQARTGVERSFWLGALRVARVTVIEVVVAALRALAVLFVWLLGARSVLPYAWAIAASGVITLLVVDRWLRYPTDSSQSTTPMPIRRALREALPFALSSLTWNALVEMPKILLAPIAGALPVGQYAAGSRVLNVAYLPLQSILHVVTPRVFASSRAGLPLVTRRRALIQSAAGVTAIAIVIAGLIALAAPLVPFLLGNEYRPAVSVLRVLAVSLPFQALAFASGDWLGGIGRQHLRVWLTLGTLAVAVPVVMEGAARAGALGAAWGLTAATGLLGIGTAAACGFLLRSE